MGGAGLGWAALTPVLAAALWAVTDVMTRWLAREETPETLTLSLLVLITPNHLALLLLANAFAFALPIARSGLKECEIGGGIGGLRGGGNSQG